MGVELDYHQRVDFRHGEFDRFTELAARQPVQDSLTVNQAAIETGEALRSALEGSHMVFITAGLGGGGGADL